MIKMINHLFEDPKISNNFYLSRFKYFIFETDDLELVKILINVRLMDNFDILNTNFKLETITNSIISDDESTMFISKYQILWDKLYLENSGL